MGNFLVNGKRVFRNFTFTLFSSDFKLLSFTIYPHYRKTIFPHPQYVAPYFQVSHSHKTVVTITVLNAELLDLVAVGGNKKKF